MPDGVKWGLIESGMTKFLSILNQIKVFHWQTKSYAEHKALGKLYESLDESVDDFVEVFSGRYGKVPRADEFFKAQARNYSSKEDVMKYLDEIVEFLEKEVTGFLEEQDTELLNIRDDMLASINRTKYLLGLS